MKIYGLIGYPLTHSSSPAFFNEKFRMLGITDCKFELFPLSSINLFPSLISSKPNIIGLAVTIPHKVSVMDYLHELDETASMVGAVNCIALKDGIKKGYNTDVHGFQQSLTPLLQRYHKNALILGNGGAAKAVAFVLDRLEIPYKKVVRNCKGNTELIEYNSLTTEIVEAHQLIINCTPLGMGHLQDHFPTIPYEGISGSHLLYDLVYQSEVTPFLAKGAINGAQIKNGWEMLQLQAEKNWELWNA